MKKFFYIGIIGIILYEIAKVYFIMPMPGSQRMNSIDHAYFLHSWRWGFRSIFWIMTIAGGMKAFQIRHKWLPGIVLALALGITYATNFEMAADTMFYQPQTLELKSGSENKVDADRLVIGVSSNGESKAYPIQYIGYHHQVRDELGGKPIIVTYCTVCRTGRVFEPLVNGKSEDFRLVGMDHFNAMFEDESTNSWWRQANGEAIAGPLKGTHLPELASTQTTLAQWLKLHPDSKIMQPDPQFQAKYDAMSRYESGGGKSELTKTDTVSWSDKSWVVGIEIGKESKAFDWNRLQKDRLINDYVGNTPIVLAMAADGKSFFAFERLAANDSFSIRNDTLFKDNQAFNLLGKGLTDANRDLKPINAYQEFWHSWQAFHPKTAKY
jgi:hypothetical protein